jgi:hypothetical protein
VINYFFYLSLKMMKKYVLLSILFGAALIFRMTGMMFGGVHPDENFGLSVRVLAGEVSPYSHFYPPLLNYLNAAAYTGMYLIGRMTGFWQGTEDFRLQWFENPLPFYFAGRMVTALFGAMASPLSFLIAEKFGCRRATSFFLGVVIAIFPIQLLLSHFSKSDVPLGTTVLLLIFVFAAFHDKQEGRLYPCLMGICSAMALCFKHSIIFFLPPFMAGALALIWIDARNIAAPIRFIAYYVPACLVAFLFFGIGIVLDFENFMNYQSVQTLMAVREFQISHLWEHFLPVLADWQLGASAFAAILWLLVPFMKPDSRVWVIWSSVSIGLSASFFLMGDRVLAHLLLPYTQVMVLFVGIVFGKWLDRRHLGYWVPVALITVFAIPFFQVMRQALQSPISYEVTQIVEKLAQPQETRILTSRLDLLMFPIDGRARLDEKKRHEALAEKYGIKLPVMPRDRVEALNRRTGLGYYVTQMPWTFGGLEVHQEEEVKTVVPYGWPIQPEEWDLDYWVDQGYTLFIVENEAFFLNSGIPSYEKLHRQIKERGELIATVDPNKPLFFESQVKVYRVLPENPKQSIQGKL